MGGSTILTVACSCEERPPVSLAAPPPERGDMPGKDIVGWRDANCVETETDGDDGAFELEICGIIFAMAGTCQD
jgi:hypothetical protein